MVVSRVINGLLTLALLVVLTRLLDQAVFGLFFILFTLYESLVALGTLGLPQSLLYFVPRGATGETRAIGVGTGLSLLAVSAVLAGVLMLLAGPIAGWLGEPELARPLHLLALFVLLDLPGQILPNYLLGRQRYNASVLVSLAFNVALFLVLVVPALLGLSLTSLMWCLVGLGAARFTTTVMYFLLGERRTPSRPRWSTLVAQLSYGMPLFIDGLVTQLNRHLDRYFIMFAFSAEVFAVYSVAARELPLVGMIPYALSAALMPRLVRLHSASCNHQFIALWHGGMLKMAAIMLPVFVFFLVEAEDFLALAFTDQYSSGALVFRIYLLLLPLRLCSYGSVVKSQGRPKHVLYATRVVLGVNLSLNWPLLQWLGTPGPAIASVLGQFASIAYLLGAVRTGLGVPWSRVFPLRGVLRAALAAAVASPPLLLLSRLDLSPAIRLAVGAPVYLVVFLFAAVFLRVLGRADLNYLIGLAGFRRR